MITSITTSASHHKFLNRRKEASMIGDDVVGVGSVSFGPGQKGEEPKTIGQAKLTIGGNTLDGMLLCQLREQLSKIALTLQAMKATLESIESAIRHRR